jgi:Raf kinase inhibitor-like YbhB/YbcL family protein
VQTALPDSPWKTAGCSCYYLSRALSRYIAALQGSVGFQPVSVVRKPANEFARFCGQASGSYLGQKINTVRKLFLALGFCLAIVAPTAFAESGGFHVISSEWQDGGSVPQKNVFNGSGCGGANISPELHWSDAPSGTKSFAITIFDLDAPNGGGWWHWVIFNIPGTVLELSAGAGNKESRRLPAGGVQCRNDYGEPGYGGPCPPPGSTHRYLVRVYALNVEKLPFGSEAPAGRMAKQIEAHSIGVAKLMVRFGR